MGSWPKKQSRQINGVIYYLSHLSTYFARFATQFIDSFMRAIVFCAIASSLLDQFTHPKYQNNPCVEWKVKVNI